MIKYLFRKFLLLIVFFIPVFLFLDNSIWIQGNTVYLFISLLLFFTAIVILLPLEFDLYLMSFLLAFIFLYEFGQKIYERSFFSFGLISTFLFMFNMILSFASSAVEFFILEDFKYLVVFFIYVSLSILVSKKFKTNYQYKSIIVSLLLFALSFIPFQSYQEYLSALNSSDNPVLFYQSEKYLYDSVADKNSFVSKFGLLTLLYREATQLIHPFYVEDGIQDSISNMLLEEKQPIDNEFSGVFEGKNLLLIEAESLNYFAIDKILTPTLYQLMNEGWVIEGYDSPLLTGSTSDIELMINTSLVPTNDGRVVFENYSNTAFPYSLANSFSQINYFSMAAHNNYGIYYNRTEMLPNLGYQFFDAIGLEAYDNALDSEVLEQIKWIMYEKDPYFSFWITFNAHQPYQLSGLRTEYVIDYQKVDEIYPSLSEPEKVYLAKNMDFDRGLKKLLIDYRNSKVLNELVIIIVGDHFAKGIFEDKDLYSEQCKEKGLDVKNCFEQPFIIWNNDITPMVYKKVSSPLDVAPTISDLFGLNYPYSYTLGHSIFDPNYEGFSFNEYNIIQTDHFTFDVLRDTLVHDGLRDEEYYREKAYDLYRNLQLSYKIIELDYFNSTEFKETFQSE